MRDAVKEKAGARLGDADRRVLVHLAIPRSIADIEHQLRIDPAAPAPGSRALPDLAGALADLESLGWVARLDARPNPGQLASDAQNHSATIALADEQAQILERRRRDPRMSWQVAGETFMLTQDGLDKIREPLVEPRAFTTSELADLISTQWEGVLTEARLREQGATFQGSVHDQPRWPNDHLSGGVLLDAETGEPFEGDAGPSLQHGPQWFNPHAGQMMTLPLLLEEEWTAWLADVLGEHERLWGEDEARQLAKRIPNAGGSQFSDAYEIILLDAENQKASITAAAPWFMALSILAFNDTDTGTTADDGTHKPTYTGYGRISVAAADMNAGSGTSGSVTNANALIGAACTSGTNNIVAFAHCSASTVGTLRKYGTCASTTVSTTQTPPQFAAGQYATTIA